MRPEDNPRGIACPRRGAFVVVYGEKSENGALADELALDGYKVDLVDDAVGLKGRLGSAELVIFGRRRLGSEVGALRALRMCRLAPALARRGCCGSGRAATLRCCRHSTPARTT